MGLVESIAHGSRRRYRFVFPGRDSVSNAYQHESQSSEVLARFEKNVLGA